MYLSIITRLVHAMKPYLLLPPTAIPRRAQTRLSFPLPSLPSQATFPTSTSHTSLHQTLLVNDSPPHVTLCTLPQLRPSVSGQDQRPQSSHMGSAVPCASCDSGSPRGPRCQTHFWLQLPRVIPCSCSVFPSAGSRHARFSASLREYVITQGEAESKFGLRTKSEERREGEEESTNTHLQNQLTQPHQHSTSLTMGNIIRYALSPHDTMRRSLLWMGGWKDSGAAGVL